MTSVSCLHFVIVRVDILVSFVKYKLHNLLLDRAIGKCCPYITDSMPVITACIACFRSHRSNVLQSANLGFNKPPPRINLVTASL